jgi:hypothetical protein
MTSRRMSKEMCGDLQQTRINLLGAEELKV